jgi:hypothetical protein
VQCLSGTAKPSAVAPRWPASKGPVLPGQSPELDQLVNVNPLTSTSSAATHLGDQKVPLQLIMAKTRHKSPRTVMRYVKPGDEAVAEVTSLLGPPRRTH